MVLGIFLLQALDPGAEQTRIEATNTTTTTLPLEGFGDAPPMGDTTVPSGPRPPAEVKVLVVNASGVQGAAGARQKALNAAGYTSVATGTAPRPATATGVQHIQGYEPEAQAVAAALNLSPTVVAPVPSAPVVPPGDAVVMVVLGTDSKPATPTTAARATTPTRATTSTSVARPTTSAAPSTTRTTP